MRTIENERNRYKQKWPQEVFYKKRCSGKFHQIHKKRPVPDWTRTKNHWSNDWAVFWVLICTAHLTVCSCHVTYAFQSESTLYSCLNVKELLPRSRREIWNISHCNWTRTQNHLVRERTLNNLAKLGSCLDIQATIECGFTLKRKVTWQEYTVRPVPEPDTGAFLWVF